MSIKELLDLAGQVAVVTGGSRGLGLAMAEVINKRHSAFEPSEGLSLLVSIAFMQSYDYIDVVI